MYLIIIICRKYQTTCQEDNIYFGSYQSPKTLSTKMLEHKRQKKKHDKSKYQRKYYHDFLRSIIVFEHKEYDNSDNSADYAREQQF